jgi:hypothetical protein
MRFEQWWGKHSMLPTTRLIDRDDFALCWNAALDEAKDRNKRRS